MPVDSQLLAQAQNGDSRAFEKLIRPHMAAVRRFARSFAQDWTDADDIAQEALIKAFRAIGSFRQEASFSTWLYRVTKNTGVDWYRGKLAKAQSREDELGDDTASDRRDQEQLVRERDRAEVLWATIGELDAAFRVPLVLFEVEGMSYDKIATIEGVPKGTIRSRLNRARKQLAEKLGESPEFARITPLPPAPGTSEATTSSDETRPK